MSLKNVDKIYKQDIVNEIAWSITNALSNIRQSEPQLVANLIYYLAKGFNKNIVPYFSKQNINASAGGIFIHQTPKVNFTYQGNPTQRCELGDLLLIFTHKYSGKTHRNALLLQAKKQNHLIVF